MLLTSPKGGNHMSERTDVLTEDEWEQVFDQVKHDLEMGEFVALFQMLDQLPPRILMGYLYAKREV